MFHVRLIVIERYRQDQIYTPQDNYHCSPLGLFVAGWKIKASFLTFNNFGTITLESSTSTYADDFEPVANHQRTIIQMSNSEVF